MGDGVGNWLRLRAPTPGELRIICPFIKVGALESLLSCQPGNVQVITWSNLADFAERVSDVAALRSGGAKLTD